MYLFHVHLHVYLFNVYFYSNKVFSVDHCIILYEQYSLNQSAKPSLDWSLYKYSKLKIIRSKKEQTMMQ